MKLVKTLIINVALCGCCIYAACTPAAPSPEPAKPATKDSTTTQPVAQSITFTDNSASLPSSTARNTMDVIAADIDGDGDKDLVLAIEFEPNVILINDGKGNFTDESSSRLPQIQRDSEDIAVADFDKDGDLDIIFVSEDDIRFNRRPTHEYYLNNGRGVFSPAPFSLPDSEANAIAVADLNNDTFPDVVMGNTRQDFILINDGRGGFRNETAQRLPAMNDITQDVKLADIDRDGDLDMFLGNEDGNAILVNNGQGVFTNETQTRLISPLIGLRFMETRKVTFEDVDKDGDLDVFLSNVAFMQGKNAQARLFINDGKGVFTDVTGTQLYSNNAFTLDGMFMDLDGDGDKDLVTVGFSPSTPFSMYSNDGKGTFSIMTHNPFGRLILGRGISMEIADLNNDGKPDVYLGFHSEPDMLFLSR